MFEREDGATERVLLPAGKPLLVLAYLAAHHPASVSRATLATLGWGTRDERHAKASLRQALYRLRQLLGRDALDGNDVSVRLAATLSSDWADATSHVLAGDDAALLAVLAGHFLEGLEDEDPDDLGNWIGAERTRWRLLEREAASREGRRALMEGRVEAAVALAERALAARDDLPVTWDLLLEALRATETATRLEDGLARLEAAGEHGLLGLADPSGWRLLIRRYRRLDGTVPIPTAVVRRADGGAHTLGVLPFTGREAVLSHLQLLLLPASEPRRIIAVIAGAGFGKSRLLRELRLRWHDAVVRLIQVEARSNDASSPFALLNRVVEALADLPEASGMDPHAAKALIAVNSRLAERFPGIGGTPLATPTHAALGHALADLIGAVSEQQPLCLAVDDAQWGDLESTELLTAAFSSAGTGKAVYLIATRDLVSLLPPNWHAIHLASLSTEDITALLVSELPTLPRPQQHEAAMALLLVTGGVPIYVMRALQQLNLLASSGASEDAIIGAIRTLVLHRDPAFPTGDADRHLLGYLAIAGGIVELAQLGALPGAGPPTQLQERLARLERAGLVVPRGDGFQLSHDLIQRQATEDLTAEEQRLLALQHAAWLSGHGQALPELQRAVRLCLTHGAAAEAAEAVRQWRRRVRGGPRGRALADLVLPVGTARRIRWRVTAAATPALLQGVTTVAVALAFIAWVIVGWLAQPASLRLENNPRVPPTDPAAVVRVRRNSLTPLFTVRDRLGRLSTALDGMALEITGWSPSVDSAKLESAEQVRGGLTTSSSLLVFSTLVDSHNVSFRVGRLPPLPVTVFRGFDHVSLRIVGGVMNGRVITAEQPEITVAPGDSLLGFVQLRYTTPSQAAVWMLAESSTMLPAIEDTATVITLHTGALDAVTEPIVKRRAPLRPGRYWLMWVFAAERDAVSILSLTNWRCGGPNWNDGNDMMTVSDSALASVWGGGMLQVERDLCEEGLPPRLLQLYPAATLVVVVREKADGP